MSAVVNDTPSKWELNDALALTALGRLTGPYVPWTSWSMRPSAVAGLANLILLSGLSRVVELGAGASTLYLARALRETGGAVLSIDESPDWTAWISDRIAAESLGAHARVHHVPLTALLEPTIGDWPEDAPDLWYETSNIETLVPADIELLVVDGPAAGANACALTRLPAIPALKPKLAPSSTVVLDDANRPAEARIGTLWARWLQARATTYQRSSITVINDGVRPFPAL